MKTTRFYCNGIVAPGYSCSKPGDNSGEYVPAEVARGLLAALENLEAFVSVMFGVGEDAVIPESVRCPLGCNVRIGESMREARAAIAAAKEPACPVAG